MIMMENTQPVRSELRTYRLTRSGHFEAAHWLPGYPGKCATLHGHRWEVTAVLEFPIISREMVSHDDPDACGMLVDFHDIDELWKEYDHPAYGPLNEVIPNPTAEVIANILLEALCDLVNESLCGHNLPFNATIVLDESPNSRVEASVYMPTVLPTDEGAPWTEWLREDIATGGEPGTRCGCGCECDPAVTEIINKVGAGS